MNKDKDEEIRRIVTRLFRSFLVVLEDLQEEHRSAYLRLLEHTPDDLKPMVAQADYLNDRKMAWLRKRILDMGNEAIRDSENYVNIRFEMKDKGI